MTDTCSEAPRMLDYDETRAVCGWKQLRGFYEDLPRGECKSWIFRGQKTFSKAFPTDGKKKCFETSLERAASDLDDPDRKNLPDIEMRLLRHFQRKAHHYTLHIPDAENTLEWLALMRHHDAPTRLLDWTYSFYVAAFNAVQHTCGEGYEVWALNTAYFAAENREHVEGLDRLLTEHAGHQRALGRLHRGEAAGLSEDVARPPNGQVRQHVDEAVVQHLWLHPTKLVHPVNAFTLNERLTIQRGVFLFPGDISVPFIENLNAAIYQHDLSNNLRRLSIRGGLERSDLKTRLEILEELYEINISTTTLFPGLDGFARSLQTHLPPS